MSGTRAGARAEWHTLREVMVHEPGVEVFFALLAPGCHLYERYFRKSEAQREHRQLCDLLHYNFDVRVHHLDEVVISEAVWREDLRSALIQLASRRLGRRPSEIAGDLPEMTRCAFEGVPDIADRDCEDLLDIVKLNPTLLLSPGGIRTELGNPLHNLYFMRDPMAATGNGMVLGRMATRERADEVALGALGLRALGTAPVHQVARGRLEGGDYMPAGDAALVGCGARTNMDGISEVLGSAPGVDEVAVVHEPVHPLIGGRDYMVSMHLDTYFNIAGDGTAVGCPLLLQGAQVEVFHKASDGYVKGSFSGNLKDYLREKEFDLIEITTLEQLCYASNFLCVRDGECISIDAAMVAPLVLKRLAEKKKAQPETYGPLLRQAEHDYQELRADAEFFPHKQAIYAHGIEMTPISLTHATGGYGGAHCMTCVISR